MIYEVHGPAENITPDIVKAAVANGCNKIMCTETTGEYTIHLIKIAVDKVQTMESKPEIPAEKTAVKKANGKNGKDKK